MTTTTVYSFYMIDTNSATIGIEPVTVTSIPTASLATRITVGANGPTSVPSETLLDPSSTSSTPTATRGASYATPSAEPQSGELIGIILGSVLGATVLIILLFYSCWRWNRQRFLPSKYDSEKNITDDSLKPSRRSRLSYRIPSQSSAQWAANLQEQWQRYPRPEEIGVAVTAPNRQSFLKRLTRSEPQRRSMLPTISAPIPTDQVSIRASLQERLCAEPTPIQNTREEPVKHTSEATTIRTSGHPSSTQSRPPITILRRWSTSTSIATSFEEEKDHRINGAPPVPTFTAIPVSVNGTVIARDHYSPVRTSLEAGIKRNVTKALSTMPLTPSYDNGYFRLPRRPSGSALPSSRLNPARSMDIKRPYMSSQIKPMASMRSTAPAKITKMTPIQSPRSSYPDIPARDSSLRSPELGNSEEWLEQKNHTWPKRANDNDSPLGSPIKHLTYPRIPTSTSELRSNNTTRPLELPSAALSSPNLLTNKNSDQFSEHDLSPSTDCDDPLEGPSNSNHIAGQMRKPSKKLTQLHLFPPSEYIPPPKATLTPNRTTTGDLVLLVDM